MNMKRVAASLSFASLLGLSKHAEDEEDKKSKRAAAEDEEARAEEECGEEEDEDKKSKKGKRAEEDDGGSDDGDMASERAEEEESDDGDEKEKGKGKSRKAKSKGESAEDEGDGDEEDGDDKSARSAIRRDRARSAAIIAHGQVTGRIHQATAAARYGLSVKVAKAILDAGDFDQPEARTHSLSERMAATNVPNVGAEGGDSKAPPGISKTAAAIIAVGEKLEKQRAQR